MPVLGHPQESAATGAGKPQGPKKEVATPLPPPLPLKMMSKTRNQHPRNSPVTQKPLERYQIDTAYERTDGIDTAEVTSGYRVELVQSVNFSGTTPMKKVCDGIRHEWRAEGPKFEIIVGHDDWENGENYVGLISVTRGPPELRKMGTQPSRRLSLHPLPRSRDIYAMLRIAIKVGGFASSGPPNFQLADATTETLESVIGKHGVKALEAELDCKIGPKKMLSGKSDHGTERLAARFAATSSRTPIHLFVLTRVLPLL